MNIKKSIFQNKYIYILLLIPIFEPDVFKEILITDIIFITFKAIVLIVVGLKYFMILNTKKRGCFAIWIGIYCLGLILTTAINSQDVFYAFKKLIECFLVCMLLEVGLYYNGTKVLRWIFNYLFILITINTILIVPFPDGLLEEYTDTVNYKVFFLGIKNSMINWVALTFIMGLLYMECTKDIHFQKRYICFLFIATCSVFFTGSSTGIIILILFITYYISLYIHKYNLSIKKIIPVLVVAFLSIIIFRVQNNFTYLFDFLFGKDASFSGRDMLWDAALSYIPEKLIFGYGIRENSVINFYGRSYTSHNLVLEILLDGGIFQLLILLLIIYVLVKRISICQSKQIKNHLTIGFILFFIAGIGGSLIYAYHWYAVCTLIYSTQIYNKEIQKRNLGDGIQT
ncbi:MAG: O-antigen ligase family protein [Eubacteriales bacterium]